MDAVDHVVLGAGAVGMAVADAPVARGAPVRVVSRSGLREPVVGVQSVAGDVTDPASRRQRRAARASSTTFIPDIGANLVALGERDDALGRVWHLPSPETRTTRDVVALVYRAAGTEPRLKSRRHGRCARSDSSTGRSEINEMRYEFDEPFIVDTSRAETELGLRATPLADAVAQTVRWYRAQANPSSAADHKRAEQVAPGRARDRALP